MKQIFASSIWTRVILVLALIFIVWSITLIVSVKRQQADLAHEAGLIDKLNGITQSIFALQKSLVATGPDSLARWRLLYHDYRTRRSEFDPSDPAFRDLQVNLIRTDSLLIRLDRLHADFLQTAADPVSQKSVEADFHREINAAMTEVQNAVQTIRRRTGEIAAAMAGNWNALFVLVLVACGLAIAVTLLLRLLQQEMVKIKTADEFLRQSEERMRQTFEHAPIGMATSTLEGKFIQVNPALCRLLGYSEAELLRRNFTEISHPDDLAAHRQLMSRLQRDEISHFQLEKRYLTQNQQIVYVLLQASLVRSSDGAAPLVIEQVVDVTEHKKAEFARQQSEERFRELAENIAEVFWLTDPAKTEILYVSPAYEEISGRTCASLYESPQQWFEAVHPDDRERVAKAAMTKQVIGQYDETYRLLRPDGEMRWIRDRAFPIRDEHGSVYRLAGVAEDVTAHKNFEAALQESEQRWSFALEGSDAGVWDWDAQTNKVFYSRRWKEMLGYQEHEIGDSLDEYYSRIHPEDLKATVAALEKHVRGEAPLYISEHRERCKDGRYKWILDRGKVIARSAEGKPLRVVGTHTDITDQMQAKAGPQQAGAEVHKAEEVSRQNGILKAIVDGMAGGVVVADASGKFLIFNPAAESLIGPSDTELSPQNWAEKCGLYLPDQVTLLPLEKNPLARAMQGETTPAVEMYVRNPRRPDGLWLSGTGVPLKNEAGEAIGGVVFFHELSLLKQAEAALRKSEERYQTLVAQLPDGIYRSTPDGRFIEVNPAIWKMHGYAGREEFLALDVPKQLYFSPDECNGVIHHLKETGSEGITIARHRHKDGHEIWVEDHGRFIYDDSGNVLYREGILRDVSARQKAEAALLASEERWRRQSASRCDLASNKVFQTGELHEVFREVTATVARSMNVARASIWLYDEAHSKIVCQNLYDLNGGLHAQGVQLLCQDFLPYFAALAEGRYIDAHEAETDDRTRCFTEAYLKPLGITSKLDAPILAGGEVIGVICLEQVGAKRQWTLDEKIFASSIADLVALAVESRRWRESETRLQSERKHVQEQLRQHAEELQQLVAERAQYLRLLEQQRGESEKLAATGRMAACIAHEINNPLAGIKNAFLLVKDGIPATHRYYDYVPRIEAEIERIAGIVRQTFDLYRPLQDAVRSFPANITIQDVVALLQTVCRERDILIDAAIDEPVLNVTLPESSLRQVLYNVIQNAIDASASGSAIRVRARSEQQKLIITVNDQGQGIPENIRAQIFEPFFTTKSGLERSGLGLGLSVSKGLVEVMGGKLDFESVAGQGTTFTIVLPIDEAAAPSPHPEAEPDRQQDETGTKQNC